jgi:hypothetical protein
MKPEPSSEHSKLDPDSLAVNWKLTVAFVVVAGGAWVMVVFGAVVSIVTERLAGVVSMFPAESIARTWKVWVPVPSAAVVCGDVQDWNDAEPTRHWKVAVSLAENSNVGVESFVVPVGPAVMVVCGATLSTVMLRIAGERSMLPAASLARTSNVCGPWLSDAVVCGVVQLANAAVSTRHWKLEPDSLLENVNVGVESLVAPVDPPVIVVSGGVESPAWTVQEEVAGLESRFPAASRARTWN